MDDVNFINIVFACDENFAAQLAVTIASILLNSKRHEKFIFFVLDGGISDSTKEKINKLKSVKDFSISYLEIRNEDFAECPIPVSSHFTKATYYRFKLPSLLDTDKVLYLDCDILVKKSLGSLYDIDLKNNYAAVVEDIFFSAGLLYERCSTLDVNKYFNAGVMLLNLKKMREDGIEKQCFEFAEKYPNKIRWVDQCILNALFKNQVLFINQKYNFQHNSGFKNIDELYKKVKDIIILHFAGREKPWRNEKPFLIRLSYYYYLSRTPFGKNLFLLLMDNFLVAPSKIIQKIRLTFKYLCEL